ncbi:MAG: 30S ribosomal protein S17 [Desulfosarcina sp.]|nr:30S ribosomal protein S17 [Desulfobacterales bacterium]
MKKIGIKRQVVGTVVSDKMNKTVVVNVERLVKHKRYHKYIKRRSRFVAHDKDNECCFGDQVLIIESKPISKTKRWLVSKILDRAV